MVRILGTLTRAHPPFLYRLNRLPRAGPAQLAATRFLLFLRNPEKRAFSGTAGWLAELPCCELPSLLYNCLPCRRLDADRSVLVVVGSFVQDRSLEADNLPDVAATELEMAQVSDSLALYSLHPWVVSARLLMQRPSSLLASMVRSELF